MSSNVRTRFAPSPTGFLHVGGMRTALFAWLVARQGKGQFILRIEDTDQKRKVEGAEEHIIKCLGWLDLVPDEGLKNPIRQSERVKDGVYQKWADKLIESGRAYADPYSPDEVQKFREQAQADKKPFLYRNHRPENPPQWKPGLPLRFKSEPKDYVTHDEVMGDIKTGPEVVDDFILIKADGFPTYNFAHIVDDSEMEISHVIRGQEFIASLPNYRNLYEALDIEPPIFATVPHIMNEQGNKKLSKRDGAKDILDYRNEGYLPETMISFLATLGWNDGTEQETFTIDELIDKFSLARVQKSGARFDERRLIWLNGAHIRQLKLDDLYTYVSPHNDDFIHGAGYWPEAAYKSKYDQAYRKKVLNLVQERLKFFAELPELTGFFFEDLPVNPELISTHKQLKKYDKSELKKYLEKAKASFEGSDFSEADLTDRLNSLLEETGEKPIVLFSLIRIATTQASSSPGLSQTMAVLGKEKCISRINAQISAL
ncbi:MAG TPA: glutamate--tRNA ligase [Candidatus Saccharimonadales bacterium]|nr:glutamate--tRNA ligase [Candidatus Saccharimonadales bacterium]